MQNEEIWKYGPLHDVFVHNCFGVVQSHSVNLLRVYLINELHA